MNTNGDYSINFCPEGVQAVVFDPVDVAGIESLLSFAKAENLAELLLEKKASIVAVVEYCRFECPLLCSPEEVGGMYNVYEDQVSGD